MGLRFRKSINLGGGAKININKNSVGVTGGIKGAHVSANSSGRVTKSAGIPGTGISFVSSSGGSSKSGSGGCITCIKWLLIICVAYFILVYAWIPAIIVGVIYFIYCRKTETEINKKYVIIGALICVVSIAAFIHHFTYQNTQPVKGTTPSSISSIV